MSNRMADASGDPRTVDEARNAVERSRKRISSTLDQLEGRIVEKKHELQDRANVLRPVREQIVQRPLTAIMVAVGVGALLGSLGGSDREKRSIGRIPQQTRHHRGEGRFLDDNERADRREWRRSRRERLRARSRDEQAEDESESRVGGLRHQLIGVVTTAIGAALTARVRDLAMHAGRSGNGRAGPQRD